MASKKNRNSFVSTISQIFNRGDDNKSAINGDRAASEDEMSMEYDDATDNATNVPEGYFENFLKVAMARAGTKVAESPSF